MRKKLLIIGCSGFIGRAIVNKINSGKLFEEYEVFCSYNKNKPDLHSSNIQYLQLDLMSSDNIDNLFKKIRPNYLINLAWFVKHKECWGSLVNYDFVKATIDLLRSFKNYGGEYFSATGTFYEYLVGSELGNNNYSITKDITRRLVSGFSSLNDLRYCWYRLFNVFGYGEPVGKLVTSAVLNLRESREVFIKNPDLKFDFISVEDVATGILDSFSSRKIGEVDVGSGVSLTTLEIAQAIAKIMGKEPSLIKIDTNPGPVIIDLPAKVEVLRDKDYVISTLEREVALILDNLK